MKDEMIKIVDKNKKIFKSKKEVVKKMLADGISSEKADEMTNLMEEEIRKIKKDVYFVYDMSEAEEAMVMYFSELAEAYEIGYKEEKQSIAQKMLSKGMAIKEIAKIAALSEKEVLELN